MTVSEETYAPSPPVGPDVECRVTELMALPYRKVITGDADEGYLATIPDLPGCMTAGETEAEALELLHDAMRGWLESNIERGLPIPEPGAASTYSGKLLVRMPKSLHRRLIERADDEGVSANQLVVAVLSEGMAATPVPKSGIRGQRDARPAATSRPESAEHISIEHGSDGRMRERVVPGE